MDDKIIAFHEAGHAAAMLVFGNTPTLATINRSDDSLGRAAHLDGDLFSKEGLEQLVMVCFAGGAAESRVGGTCEGCQGDDEEAAEYIRLLGRDEAEMRLKTESFIREHWQLVELLADQLIEKTSLDGDELSILYDVFNSECEMQDLYDYRDLRSSS